MQELVISELSPADANSLSHLLTADEEDYGQYFMPFSADPASLEIRLREAEEDRYWGLWFGAELAGFFMLRGFDEGYQRPSFGVYISGKYSNRGLSRLALDFSMGWCRLNGVDSMMLKVHPDNRFARRSYEKAGFRRLEICSKTGHDVMVRFWETE